MPVTQREQSKPCEVQLEIEVAPDEFSKSIDEAYREVGQATEVPGFRKGKAPRAILEKYVSEERVLERAAKKAVLPAYEQALDETGIEPFADANYEIVRLGLTDPFVFKATVPLAPTVELGSYVGIEAEKLVRRISDEDVDQEIDRVRERAAKVNSVEDRPVQTGDLVIVRITEPDGDTRESVVEAGKNLPTFDEGLIGMSIGQTKTIELAYPEDFEDPNVAGTRSYATVSVTGIKERQIPELTDEFVRELAGEWEEKIETVEDLRTYARAQMDRAASDLADREVESKLLERVVESSKVCFPDLVIDHEVAHRLQDLLRELDSRKTTLEDYLRATETNFRGLESRMRSSAERDLKITLVLDEIGRRENIEVTDQDVEAEVEKMAEEGRLPKESLNAYLDKTGGRRAVRSRILRRKVLDFLVHASNIKTVGRTAP